MGIEAIRDNPNAVKLWIENEEKVAKQYYQDHPDSLVPQFEKELSDLGFDVTSGNHLIRFMPKHKNEILPVAITYYQLAKEQRRFNEQNYFMSFLGFKGFDEAVPLLLSDYDSENTPDLTRWFISDCLYRIRARQFTSEYVAIASNPIFGRNRQMIILLLGKLREECALPTLISLLDDESVRMHAICALGCFKKPELRCYFERYLNDKNPGCRKYAKTALKKLTM